MSLSFVTTSFIGLVGAGSGLPALALVMGYPKPVTDGLGSTIENFSKSNESKLGLYLYTVSDILLGGLCTISVVMLPNNNNNKTSNNDNDNGPTVGLTVTQTTALVAIACHQFGYLAAAVPAFGGVRNVATFWSSLITGTVSAGLAAWITYHHDDYY